MVNSCLRVLGRQGSCLSPAELAWSQALSAGEVEQVGECLQETYDRCARNNEPLSAATSALPRELIIADAET